MVCLFLSAHLRDIGGITCLIYTVVVEYKDCFARFGFSYLETYIRAFGGSIVIIDQEEKNEQQELVEDLIAITTSFSARIYGKRGGKKLVDAVTAVLHNPMKDGEQP